MIGDPSGRSDMRQMLTKDTIQHNIDCFKKQMSRFIDFSDGKALMVNNAEWLLNLNYVEFCVMLVPHFSVKPYAYCRVLQTAYGKGTEASWNSTT